MNRKWTLLSAALLSLSAVVAHAASTPFTRQVPIGTQNRVLINNIAGSVAVSSWDRREVDVQGELESNVERVDVKTDNGFVDIKVVLKSWDRDRHGYDWGAGEARLKIRVPADAQTEIETVSADVSLNGLRGRQRVRSVSGDIRSDSAGSDLELNSVSGNIDLTGSGAAVRLRAASVSGTVTLNHVGGDVEARSVSGDLDIDLQGAVDVHANVVSGDITLRGSLASEGDLELSSVSGRVKVNAQAASGFNYDVNTFSGHIRNCFDREIELKDRSSGKRLTGTRGEGKASIRLKSHSGTLELCDR
ncbi:MAG TPA: DUF4097 family beta strand repeat-containing protein [Steroidobacteraceae bacterium]|nr:DUF4097 family beta strand repeat-containing protein [Steroidobacteraceae bacterium]